MTRQNKKKAIAIYEAIHIFSALFLCIGFFRGDYISCVSSLIFIAVNQGLAQKLKLF